MPYKMESDGNISFEGSIVPWVQFIQEEHRKSGSACTFQQYMPLFVMSASNLAKEQWSSEWFGKNKIAKLDSMVSTDADGNIQLNIFDVLNFLAENLSVAFLNTNQNKITGQVRALLT